MSCESQVVPSGLRKQGPCHRCGWVTSLTRVSRRDAHRFDMERHVSRLCDECLEDLRRGPVEPSVEPAHSGRKFAHWREVA